MKKDEKIKETFIKELAAFITDFYIKMNGYYYPSFIEVIENILYDDYLYNLQEENPDVDLDEAEDNYEMDMEDFKYYVECYLNTSESLKEIVENVGKTVINKFLKEYSYFGIDDDDNLTYYESLGIGKHIQLRYEHPQDFDNVLENRNYVLRGQVNDRTAYKWLLEDRIYEYFRELKITDEKLFEDLFWDVYYDLVEGGQLYRETVIKF